MAVTEAAKTAATPHINIWYLDSPPTHITACPLVLSMIETQFSVLLTLINSKIKVIKNSYKAKTTFMKIFEFFEINGYVKTC